MLHGITASGEVFGAPYDVLGARARVVVPDLLGFGRSMDPARADFSLEAHLAALDAMADSLGLGGLPITLAGHSLGALLALHWAARRQDVTRVIAFCAPLYLTPAEADARIRAMGTLERLFALESPLTAQMCAWMCAHRTAAQWLVVALEPQWPVALARMGVFHTWPAYLGAMNGVIRNGGWEASLQRLAASAVPVTLANGGRDQVPVPGRADELAERHGNVQVMVHPDADHELPISDPGWCLGLLG